MTAAAVTEPGDVLGVVLGELHELREALLDYNAEADRHGEAWDDLRVKLDLRLGVIRALVIVARGEGDHAR